MDLMARRRMIMAKKALTYDAEVEYLQNGIGTYIDTGVNGNNDNLIIEMDFMYSNFVSYGGFFGNYVDENTNTTRLILTNSDNNSCYGNHNCRAGLSTTISSHVTKNIRHYIKLESTKATIDNHVVNIIRQNGNVNNTNIALFNSKTASSSSDKKQKVYSFKIYDGSNLILDFIPVRIGTTGYMYDKVSKQLFGNAGTGNFILGPDIN